MALAMNETRIPQLLCLTSSLLGIYSFQVDAKMATYPQASVLGGRESCNLQAQGKYVWLSAREVVHAGLGPTDHAHGTAAVQNTACSHFDCSPHLYRLSALFALA
jgi:hypothetical protein